MWCKEELLRTSLLVTFAAFRSVTEPFSAAIRWSQWIVEGTAVLGRPDEMNESASNGRCFLYLARNLGQMAWSGIVG